MYTALNSSAPLVRPSSPIYDTSYEATEKRCILNALKKLRDCCKTAKAQQSFESFETQIHGTVDLAEASHVQPLHNTADSRSRAAPAINRDPVAVLRTKAFPTQGFAAKWIQPEISMPSILGRLAKSKTTGDMSDISSHSTSTPAGGHLFKARKQSTRPILHHRRQSATTTTTVSASIEASREPPSTVESIADSNSHEIFSMDTPRRRPNCHCRTSSFSSGRFDEVAAGVTASILESGHSRSPSPVPAPTPKYRVSMVGNVKVIRSRRSHERRSSSDVVKDIWNIGVGQVRRISRRVSGGDDQEPRCETVEKPAPKTPRTG